MDIEPNWRETYNARIAEMSARASHPNAIADEAAGAGDIDMLKYLDAEGYPISPMACTMAAQNGHLETLQYLQSVSRGWWWSEDVCAAAARGGYLEILQWARKYGADWDERVCSYAAKKGHTAVLEWARANGAPE